MGLAPDTSVADYIRKLNASLNLPASLGVLLIGVLATPMIVNMAPISDRIIGASRLGGFNALQFFNAILFPLKHVAGGEMANRGVAVHHSREVPDWARKGCHHAASCLSLIMIATSIHTVLLNLGLLTAGNCTGHWRVLK